jgi:transposase
MGSKKYHDAEWLRDKYHGDGLTLYEIADECDVTATTISSWMDKHEIETRDQSDAQQPEGKHTDREWLAEQYHGKGRALADIGDECDVSAATVMKWMEKHNIPRRSYTDHLRKERVTIAHTSRGYVSARSRTPQDSDKQMDSVWIHQLVAIADGADPHKVFSDGDYQCHHVNGVKWDNRPTNIELLSQYEHDTLHTAERERADTGEFL